MPYRRPPYNRARGNRVTYRPRGGKAGFRSYTPASSTARRPSYSRRRTLLRKRNQLRHKPTVSRPPAVYSDAIVTKLRMHWLQNGAYNTFDTTTDALANNIQRVRLNAGGNQQPFLRYGDGATTSVTGTTKFLNWEPYSIRYNSCRPIGCKVTIRFSVPDSTVELLPNVPVCFGIFPYVFAATGGTYSNEWDETATIPFNLEAIGTMKYGTVKRYYGAGSRSYVTYSKYIPFPKLVGRTYNQYMADTNFNYNTTSGGTLQNPNTTIALAILPVDLVAPDIGRNYNMEINITQYVKFESSRLSLEDVQ